MKILLKSFHLKLSDVVYHPGDEVEIDEARYKTLALMRAGAFEVINDNPALLEEAKKPKKRASKVEK